VWTISYAITIPIKVWLRTAKSRLLKGSGDLIEHVAHFVQLRKNPDFTDLQLRAF
jgi:hypothetical protein